MKKFKVILGWSVVMAYLALSLSFVATKQRDTPCRYIKIDILDSLYNGFVTKEDIYTIVTKKYPDVLGNPIKAVNTETLETEVFKNRAVKHCDIFTTVDGTLHIEVVQRKPILRVINNRDQSYYIDEEGFLIPFSSIQTPNILVATGHIRENRPPDLSKYGHIDSYEISGKDNILSDLQDFAAFVDKDPFWKAQIVQVYVDKKGELELIPRVGAHIIILGKTEDHELKMAKLKTLYVKALNNLGWNEYETINLKYKNQVICSKR